jgi:hypothetical protein
MPSARLSRLLSAVLAAALLTLSGHAMSVVVPSFPELVATADTIIRGEVTDVHSAAVATAQGQAIKTFVTLHVERALKGSAGETFTLELLGGTVGTRTLRVPGMPVFKVGQRGVVFISENGQVLCPLVSAGYGRFQVRHDAATERDYVVRDNGTPLTSIDGVTQPMSELPAAAGASSPARALSLADFETQIAAQVQRAVPVQKIP